VNDWTIARLWRSARTIFGHKASATAPQQIPNAKSGPVQVRFSNSGKKNYLRAETHLIYQTRGRLTAPK
jgi:hypothetical protein